MFTNCLEFMQIEAPYFNIKIKKDFYCYSKWDNKPNEIIKVNKKKNKLSIDYNDIIKTLNKYN